MSEASDGQPAKVVRLPVEAVRQLHVVDAGDESACNALAAQVADWLASTGYPLDTDQGCPPPPEALRLPIAEAWWRADGVRSLQWWIDTCTEMGGWT